LAVTGLPVVASIDPVYGSIHGGTMVTITGNGFGTILDTTVVFGSASAQIITITQTSIDCVAPANAAGAVDIQVT
jgi:hypothetical protein